VAERPDDGLDVPLTRVGGGGRSSRRRVAIVGLAAVTLGWLVVAGLSGRNEDRQTAVASGTALAASGATASPIASGGPVRPRASDLPEIADVALPGAPAIVFVARDGDDAELLSWRPGSPALESVGSFMGAFPPDASNTVAWLSPDLASLVVSTVDDPLSEGEDPVRLVTEAGIEWESTGVTSYGGLVWSPDGDRFAMSGRHDRWLLVVRHVGHDRRCRRLGRAGGGRPVVPRAITDPAGSL
jgi:hypothetical protein